MSEVKNYYEVLEIPSSARSEEVYQSYQRAKMAYSNDSLALYSLMSPEECRNILELVEEAYSILSDPQKRKRYDEVRGINSGFQSTMPTSFNDKSESSYSSDQKIPSSHSNNHNQGNGLENSHLFNTNDFKINANRETQPLTASGSTASNLAGNLQTNVSKLVTQKRFSLDFVANADFEREIEEATEFSGEFLRKIREYKNVDLDRLADMTKVSRMHLQNIEAEDFTKLPAHVYVRGFVFQYAKCLKLKPDLVANSYVNRMKKLK